MDIDKARRLGKCRHCEQPWAIGHSCEKKKAAQAAYQQRTGTQRREMHTETVEERLAKALDKIDCLAKELKDAGI